MIQGSMVMPTRYISETRSERGGFISNPPKGAPRGQLPPKDTGKTSEVTTGLHQQANGSSAQPVGNRVPPSNGKPPQGLQGNQQQPPPKQQPPGARRPPPLVSTARPDNFNKKDSLETIKKTNLGHHEEVPEEPTERKLAESIIWNQTEQIETDSKLIEDQADQQKPALTESDVSGLNSKQGDKQVLSSRNDESKDVMREIAPPPVVSQQHKQYHPPIHQHTPVHNPTTNISSLIDLSLGLREELDDKRELVRSYIFRIQAMEERIRSQESEVERLKSSQHEEVQILLREEEMKWRDLALKRIEDIVVRERKEVAQGLERLRTIREGIKDAVEGMHWKLLQEEEEDRLREERWDERWRELTEKFLIGRTEAAQSTEDLIKRVQAQLGTSAHLSYRDEDIEQILAEQRDQAPRKRYVYEKIFTTFDEAPAMLGLNPAVESHQRLATDYKEFDVNLYQTQRPPSIRGSSSQTSVSAHPNQQTQQIHVGSSSVKSHTSNTNKPNGQNPELTSQASDPKLLKHKPTSSSNLADFDFKAADDIPDNTSVASRQSKKNLFKKNVIKQTPTSKEDYYTTGTTNTGAPGLAQFTSQTQSISARLMSNISMAHGKSNIQGSNSHRQVNGGSFQAQHFQTVQTQAVDPRLEEQTPLETHSQYDPLEVPSWCDLDSALRVQ